MSGGSKARTGKRADSIAVHIVTWQNLGTYHEQLEQYFRLRHRLYVDGYGWEDLRRPDGREIDDFDTPNAIYLLVIENGICTGGSRLISTVYPTLISKRYAHLCERGVPQSASKVDWTRFCVAPEKREGSGISLQAAALYCSVMEYALMQAQAEIVFVAYTYWMNRFTSVGWRVNPLGLTEPCDSRGSVFVGSIEVNHKALARAQDRLGISTSLLTSTGMPRPIAPPPVLSVTQNGPISLV